MKHMIYLGCIFLILACSEKKKQKTSQIEKTRNTTSIKVFDYKGLKPLLEKQNDTTYVVNFWATWCKPCVEELPVFEKFHTEIGSKKQKVLLVSLDFPNHIEKQLIPFIEKRNLKPEVIVLNDPDTNTWIPKIAKDWSGAIPATLIYNKNKRAFYEESFDFEKLDQIFNTF